MNKTSTQAYGKKLWLIIITIIFFLLINTTYFWEDDLGGYAMFALMLLLLVFVVLFFTGVYQLNLAFRERFKNKPRLIVIGTILIVLTLTGFYPVGIINFEKPGVDLSVLIAGREGAANCHTTLMLESNGKFYIQDVCFRNSGISGTYTLNKDTIHFKNNASSDGLTLYAFAVVKMHLPGDKKMPFDIYLFKNYTDTVPLGLSIVKNNLATK